MKSVEPKKKREICGFCLFKRRGANHENGDHHKNKVPQLKGKR